MGSVSLSVRFHLLFHRVMNCIVRSHRDSMSSRPRLIATKYAYTANFVPSASVTSVLRTGLVSGSPCFWHHARVEPLISLVWKRVFTFCRCVESFHFSFRKEGSLGQQDVATAYIMDSLCSRNFSRRFFPTGVSIITARVWEASSSMSFPYLAIARHRILLGR